MNYLTIQEVSDILKSHPNTVYKMCRDGVLPAVKIGKSWRIDRRQLSRFMKTGVDKECRGQTGVSRSTKKTEIDYGHIMGIFSSAEEIWSYEAAFFKKAPSRDYRMVKACWWQDPGQVRRALTRAGVPVARWEAEEKMVILDLTEIFKTSGPKGAANAWHREATASLDRGFRGLYGTGSPNLNCCRTFQALLEFESTLDQLIKHLPVLGFCSYVFEDYFSAILPQMGALAALHDRIHIHLDSKNDLLLSQLPS